MKVILVLLGTIFLMPVLALGQSDSSQVDKTEYTDAIVLKSGGKIIGKITDRKENKSVTIEREDGLVLEVPFRRINTITTVDKLDVVQTRVRDSLAFTGYLRTESRERMSVRLGVMTGDAQLFFTSSFVFGSSIGKSSFMGAGVGYDLASDRSFLPLFLEFRGYELVGSLPVYFLMQFGYANGWRQDYAGSKYGGMLFAFGIATDVSMNDGLALSGIIDYRLQGGLDEPHTFSYKVGIMF